MSRKTFILVTFLTIVFYNFSRYIGWKFFAQAEWFRDMIGDRWHHYQLGFLLIVIAFIVLRKKLFARDLFLSIGSGMVIDESMYFFYPLNSAFSHYSFLGILFEFMIFTIFALILFRLR